MSDRPLTVSGNFIFCVPPHTHALLRYRLTQATPSHLAYAVESGVTVDRKTGAPLGDAVSPDDSSPVRLVPRAQVDVMRAWEGVPPEEPVYYSSFAAFQMFQELALVQYGLDIAQGPTPEEELAQLRQAMMDAHPDRGGSDAAFAEARAAFDAVRRATQNAPAKDRGEEGNGEVD